MMDLLLLHAFSCFFMTGAIWLVQVLVYPFFKIVGPIEFERLHQFHMKQITWVVAPVMMLELLTAASLFYFERSPLFFWNLSSVVLLWLLTAFVNVPCHNQLKFDSEVSKTNLILKNWPRTLIWSLRSVFLGGFLFTQTVVGGL